MKHFWYSLGGLVLAGAAGVVVAPTMLQLAYVWWSKTILSWFS